MGAVTTPLAMTAGWMTALGDEATDSKTGAIGPGLTAFLIVAALGVATFLLVRSMLAQIKKVPPTFDEPSSEEAGSTETAPTDPASQDTDSES